MINSTIVLSSSFIAYHYSFVLLVENSPTPIIYSVANPSLQMQPWCPTGFILIACNIYKHITPTGLITVGLLGNKYFIPDSPDNYRDQDFQLYAYKSMKVKAYICINDLAMTTVTLHVESNEDYELLLQLLKRLKVKVLTTKQASSVAEQEKLLSIIKKGGSGKSISNPVKWQREIRKDRNLPRTSK